MSISDIPNCAKCGCKSFSHRDNICYGKLECRCIEFEEPPVITLLNNTLQTSEQSIIYSRTSVPLPQFISTHDNWTGKGWEYLKKWDKTQSEMVEILHFRCKLNEDEIRIFLRCKHSSVRGRLSELNARRSLRVGF